MQFTVTSRGRPIGTTDLGFLHFGGTSRSGWFHPTPEGEKLIAGIASLLPGMRAWFMRDVRDDEGKSILQPDFVESTLFADLAERVRQTAALELAIVREDGTIVPTTDIGVQDMEERGEVGRALFAREEEEAARRGWQPEDDLVELEDDDVLRDASGRDISDAFAIIIDGETGERTAWEPDEEELEPVPRYQIHVQLANPADFIGKCIRLH